MPTTPFLWWLSPGTIVGLLLILVAVVAQFWFPQSDIAKNYQWFAGTGIGLLTGKAVWGNSGGNPSGPTALAPKFRGIFSRGEQQRPPAEPPTTGPTNPMQ